MELLDAYRRAVDEFVSRVETVRPEQWTARTPCADWDVRALVNHVVGEDRWTVPLFTGQTIADVGDRLEGDLLGTDPQGNAVDAAKQAEAAVSAPGALELTVPLSFGPTPAREYAAQLLADHLIHAWDLAAAIDGNRRLDPVAVAACAEWFTERETEYRHVGAIGQRIETS